MESALGLGTFGFWLFIASVVVASMWFDFRKRESEQESLRRLVESGRDIDREVLDRILAAGSGWSRADEDLKIGGLIVLFISFGLLVLGWFLSELSAAMWPVMLGVSGLVAFVAVGLFVAGVVCERWNRQD